MTNTRFPYQSLKQDLHSVRERTAIFIHSTYSGGNTFLKNVTCPENSYRPIIRSRINAERNGQFNKINLENKSNLSFAHETWKKHNLSFFSPKCGYLNVPLLSGWSGTEYKWTFTKLTHNKVTYMPQPLYSRYSMTVQYNMLLFLSC